MSTLNYELSGIAMLVIKAKANSKQMSVTAK